MYFFIHANSYLSAAESSSSVVITFCHCNLTADESLPMGSNWYVEILIALLCTSSSTSQVHELKFCSVEINYPFLCAMCSDHRNTWSGVCLCENKLSSLLRLFTDLGSIKTWVFYGGPEGRPLRTFCLERCRPSQTFCSTVALRERSLVTTLSPIALRECSIATALTPVTPREHFHARFSSALLSRMRT